MPKNNKVAPPHASLHPVFSSAEEIQSHLGKLDVRIEQVQELMQDGIPYIDALKVKIEIGVKETIREIFGEASKEFRVFRKHRIDIRSHATIAYTLSLLQDIQHYLEDHESILLGTRQPSSDPVDDHLHGFSHPPDFLSSSSQPNEALPTTQKESAATAKTPPEGEKPLRPLQPTSVLQTTHAPSPSNIEAFRERHFPSIQQTTPAREVVQDIATPHAPQRPGGHMASPVTQTKPPTPSPPGPQGAPRSSTPASFIEVVKTLLARFHTVVRQLRERSEGRPPLEVEDEHDIRDVLRALLYIACEDVALEEWAPTNNPHALQRDFLVQPWGIVIFVAKTRSGMGVKELTDRWTATCRRYAARPDCHSILGFMYDPEGRIPNPRRLEADLHTSAGGGKSEVLIFPK